MGEQEVWVIQICHGYASPFMDCARQYAALFKDSRFKVATVYLTGKACQKVEAGTDCDEVHFLEFSSADLSGLKLKAIAAVRRLLAARPYQLCVAHRYKSVHVALLAGRLPVVAVSHAFGVYSKLPRRLFVRVFQRRLLLLGVSKAIRDDMRSCLPGWPHDRIEVLYNRIDVDAYLAGQLDRQSARAELGLDDDAWVVGTVGRVHPKKDPLTLVKAFASALPALPNNAQLVFIGDGEKMDDVLALAQQLGVADRVRMLGYISHAWRYFKIFDLFVLATRREPFGMVLLEAMTAGVPIICTDCGGSKEVVEGIGTLFRHRDAEGLARLLRDHSAPDIDLAEQMHDRLRTCYSDDAVRKAFWDLPWMRKTLQILSNETSNK